MILSLTEVIDDVLLARTTAPIAIGDTIVPDTNCTTTTVATELARIEAEIPSVGTVTAEDVTFDPTGTTIPATATDVDKAIKAIAPQGSVQVVGDGVKHLRCPGQENP